MSHPAAETFIQAARSNLDDSRRRGSTLWPDGGQEIIVSGDIHGNRAGMQKIIQYANLPRNPQRLLVLQEIIHGPADPLTGHDRSIELLMRAARLRLSYPAQVLFVLGNHDLAQATLNEITKHGAGVCKAFTAGIEAAFGPAADEVTAAVNEFLMSAPLAIRCPNGVLVSHSLPSPGRMQLAGVDVLDRSFEPADLRRGGSVYEWTWGRGQTAQQLETLAAQVKADYFILGHRHADEGYEILSPRGMSISSDRERGVILQFKLDEPFTAGSVEAAMQRINSLRETP